MARLRCTVAGCQSHLMPLWLVIPIVAIVSTLAIMFPFLDAIGFKSGQVVVFTFQNYVVAGVLSLLWLLTIMVSSARRHDHAIECLIDTFGIPGFVGSAIFFGRGLGIHF